MHLSLSIHLGKANPLASQLRGEIDQYRSGRVWHYFRIFTSLGSGFNTYVSLLLKCFEILKIRYIDWLHLFLPLNKIVRNIFATYSRQACALTRFMAEGFSFNKSIKIFEQERTHSFASKWVLMSVTPTLFIETLLMMVPTKHYSYYSIDKKLSLAICNRCKWN